MGCIYSDFHSGKCQLLWDEDENKPYEDSPYIDKNGCCVVDEDEFPECGDFSSDSPDELCPECGNEWISDNNICDCGYCVECGYTPCECEIVEEDEKSF